jgi:uncharacterized protein YjbJ (UPF0337 family)
MKKQLLNEINEMKYLFDYQRGVVISEQLINPSSTSTIHTTPPGDGWKIISPIVKPMMIKQGYEVKQDSKGNWYSAKPIKSVPDWDKVVKYYSGNTDSRWVFDSIRLDVRYGSEIIKMKSKDTNKPNEILELASRFNAQLSNWKGRSGVVDGTWKWEGNRPVIKFEEKTKKASGYVKDTDNDWGGVTDDNKIVGLGAKGSLVKEVQSALIYAGYSGSTNTPITKDIEGCKLDYEKCDGIYGKSTKEMVKQLQKDYGLDVDGIVGNQTYEALGGALSFAKVK